MHRVARRAVRPLAATPVTPNQLTTLRLLTGFAAAAAFALGTEGWRMGGAGILLVSLFLDRADGELARLSGKSSSWGHTYDLISDALSNAAIFVGLGVGLRGDALGPWAPVMGLIAGLAVAAVLVFMMRVEELDGRGAAHLRGFAGWDPDDAMVLVPLLIWAGWAKWVVIAACIGAPAFGLYIAVTVRRRRLRTLQ